MEENTWELEVVWTGKRNGVPIKYKAQKEAEEVPVSFAEGYVGVRPGACVDWIGGRD